MYLGLQKATNGYIRWMARQQQQQYLVVAGPSRTRVHTCQRLLKGDSSFVIEITQLQSCGCLVTGTT